MRFGPKESKELVAKGYEPVRKRTRWLLLKRPENLSEKQQTQACRVCCGTTCARCGRTCSRRTSKFLLGLHLAVLGWAVPSTNGCPRTMRSRIEPMKKMARTLRNHRTLLLNWFRAKGAISAGTVEGFNTKGETDPEKVPTGFGPIEPWKSPCIMALALYPNRE